MEIFMYVLRKKLFGIYILGILFIAGQVQAFDLVCNRQAKAIIVIPDESFSSIQRAAEELQYHVQEASGAKLDIVKESLSKQTEYRCIYLGNCHASHMAGIVTEDLARNGFVIKTAGSDLFMAGRDTQGNWLQLTGQVQTGTLFAVYEFLDSVMGVRWLWPGKLGEVIPQTKNISIGDCEKKIVLPLLQTRLRVQGVLNNYKGWAKPHNRDKFLNDQNIWLSRHRFSWDSSLDIHHAFTSYWKRFGTTHPEYFSLLSDGKRHPPYGISDELISMCVAEPNLWNQIIEDWKINRTPEYPYIDVSENDTSGQCTCKKCLAWDCENPLHPGSLSDRYAKFMLAVQKLAQKTDHNAVVMAFAYSNYREPPVQTRLNERVILGVVPELMYPWTESKRQSFRTQWNGWSDAGAKLILRPNYTLDGHCMPIFFARKLGKDFSFALQNGMIATDFDSLTGQYATQGPNLYVLSRIHRDGTRDVDDILDEYYQAFGSAEPFVREYFKHWQQVSDTVMDDTFTSDEAKVKSPEGGHYAKFYLIADVIFTPDVMAKGSEILAKAEKAAQYEPKAKARVVFLRNGLKNAELTLAVQKAYRQYKETGEVDSFSAALGNLDAHRATVEGDYISNMGYLTWSENLVWDRSVVEKQGVEISSGWKFMWDTENTGVSNGWQTKDFDDTAWFDIKTNGPWEEQPVGKQWKRDTGRDYDGFAWYRNHFVIQSSDEPQSYFFKFGAVDEACEVWVNGQLVLERPYPYKGDPYSWTHAFEVDITRYICFDQPNTIAVHVEDNAGAGGIWRSVRLRKEKTQ